MQHIPLETQTLYAELLDRLIAFEAARAIEHLPGGFATKEVKGNTYYYYQHSEPGRTRKQVYLGRETPALLKLIQRHQKGQSAIKDEMEDIQRLCTQVGIGGAVVSHHAHARVLQSLADAGVFRMGGVLVGTHAFAVLGNVLGYRWAKSGMETQDVDIVGERGLDLALPGLQTLDVPGALERLEMGFFPAPSLNPKDPATSFMVRKNALRVDVLTPSKSRDEDDQAVKVPQFQTAARALRYLDYLIESPLQAAVINAGGILVQVPDPARFAFHKLIVAQERPASEHTKRNKDLRQASLMFTVLAEERPGDLLVAWKNLIGRGEGWKRKCLKGLSAMQRRHPETPDIMEVLREEDLSQ